MDETGLDYAETLQYLSMLWMVPIDVVVRRASAHVFVEGPRW